MPLRLRARDWWIVTAVVLGCALVVGAIAFAGYFYIGGL